MTDEEIINATQEQRESEIIRRAGIEAIVELQRGDAPRARAWVQLIGEVQHVAGQRAEAGGADDCGHYNLSINVSRRCTHAMLAAVVLLSIISIIKLTYVLA